MERLDKTVHALGLVSSRSQAESFIRLGKVVVNGKVVTKAGHMVRGTDLIALTAEDQYVSRAGLKLASVTQLLHIDFRKKTVLDVGSSTGGFTDYALRNGADLVIAVDVGTDQLHPTLRGHTDIELHEKTDIRSFSTLHTIDIVVADVSFISLREILPHVKSLCTRKTDLVIMVKPQFEASQSSIKHKGVIKNDTMRRQVLKDFEDWAKQYFFIADKADSEVAGSKGNRERFYLLRSLGT